MPSNAKSNQDAYLYLANQLHGYGIWGIASVVWDFLKKGYTEDRILIEVQETKEWKRRFAANEARRAKGLPVLSPAEYIGAEASYRQILQQAGLPKGFYDSNKDFQKWLENDVSPNEISQRVKAAQKVVESADPRLRDTFEKFYTRGDLVAYALDPKRTADLVEKQVAAAELASEAQINGFPAGGSAFHRETAERLVERGIGRGEAAAGFAQARRLSDNTRRLSSIYAGDDYGDYEAIAETFFDDDSQAAKRRRLASQERAAFSGRSGLGDSSLSNRRAGTL